MLKPFQLTRKIGPVSQLVERPAHYGMVAGSSPARPIFSSVIHNPTLNDYNQAKSPKEYYSVGRDQYLVTGTDVFTLSVLNEHRLQAIELRSHKFIWPWGKGRKLIKAMADQGYTNLMDFLRGKSNG